ncbi:MAG: hypothetical protein AABY22_09180 [Nanoarchaeota archaeon]
MKICSKCKKQKPYNQFFKHTKSWDGYNSWCKQCKKEYYQKPEVQSYRKEYLQKYYQLNKEHKKEYNKQYRQKNKEWARNYEREYRKKNKDKLHQNQKRYDKTWKGIFLKLKHGARKRKIDFFLEKTLFENWWRDQCELQSDCCYYCDIPLEYAVRAEWMEKMDYPITRFTVDRKDSYKGYTWDNIVLACGMCQFAKRHTFEAEIWREMAQLGVKPLWQKLFIVDRI